MAEVIPFRGVFYNPAQVPGSTVTAPPYDIITPEFKETLYNRSPYNIVHIDSGKNLLADNENENRYTRARDALNKWLKEGILIRDAEPFFYCYEATYTSEGIQKQLRGFIGAVRLEELEGGNIHPHEKTHSKPKTDRLNLMRFCMANISPIFALYSSHERHASSILDQATKDNAFIESIDEDGFIHRLWAIKDKNCIDEIKKELTDKAIFIADGHHRYETALDFRNEMQGKGFLKTGLEPFNYVMMFLANIEDNGLNILPTHRLVTNMPENVEGLLKPFFDITAFPFNSSGEESVGAEFFKSMHRRGHSLGMYLRGENVYYVLNFKGSYSHIDAPQALRTLDVVILHNLILEDLFKIAAVDYEMNFELAVKKVKQGDYGAVFLLNPTGIKDVKAVALAGERMPPKSTYFYPKLLTGMVINKFD
ncbi:MAG TPA: DUF1015 domain-containing protein [Nitrospiraceae bacterium]|nr:DUF1015 domain-containing protein [Nitrospiraceae bacterium]